MSMVCILGAGELGGSIAHALARGERADRVLLVDAAGKAAAGKALDIQQSGAVEGFQTRLDGTDDPSRAIGCAVLVVADRFGPSVAEWQGDEAFMMLSRLTPDLDGVPLVFAGAQQQDVIVSLAREARLPRERLIGSAPEAVRSAIISIVAMEARCSPTEVMLTVLGSAPGRSGGGFVVPWSEASIGGYALERVLTQVQITRIDARVARLWPPGPFTLGQAAAAVCEAVITSSRRAFSVTTVLDGEFGIRGRAGALPALLSRSGIVHNRVPTLNTRERVLLESALGPA